MIDYYNLYEYCQLRTKELKKIKDTQLKNKEIKLKKQLFKEIITGADNEIKKAVNLGYSRVCIYESEYSRLIEELMDSLLLHFKPFNVFYKIKPIHQKSFMENLLEEENYIVIIDWSINNISEMKTSEELKKQVNINEIISDKIAELPQNSTTIKNNIVENKIIRNYVTKNKNVENDNAEENVKNDNVEENVKNDNAEENVENDTVEENVKDDNAEENVEDDNAEENVEDEDIKYNGSPKGEVTILGFEKIW